MTPPAARVNVDDEQGLGRAANSWENAMMNLRLNAKNTFVGDVAVAVAWRLDPVRQMVSDRLNDPRAREVVDRVFIDSGEAVIFPPRLARQLATADAVLPEERSGARLRRYLVEQHILAALSSDVASAVQNPERPPFVIVSNDGPADAVYVDIRQMLGEYEQAGKWFADFQRTQQEEMRMVIRNSVTPRFDGIDLKLEEMSAKLDATFKEVTAIREVAPRFDSLDAQLKTILARLDKSPS
jgi:hypothetical protein